MTRPLQTIERLRERKPQPLTGEQRAALKSEFGFSDAEVANRARILTEMRAYAGYAYLLLGEGMCTMTVDGGPEERLGEGRPQEATPELERGGAEPPGEGAEAARRS